MTVTAQFDSSETIHPGGLVICWYLFDGLDIGTQHKFCDERVGLRSDGNLIDKEGDNIPEFTRRSIAIRKKI